MPDEPGYEAYLKARLEGHSLEAAAKLARFQTADGDGRVVHLVESG